MKKDRNCGMNAMPNYGPMMPNMAPNGMMPGPLYNNGPQGMMIPTGDNLEQQINTMNQKISNLERRVSTLESLNNSTGYNNTGYQMM